MTTKKELFDKLVTLYNEVWELEADIKQLIDDVKEEKKLKPRDISRVKKIAKAKAYSKVSALEQTSKEVLEEIKELLE
jgi:hypothetical protein